MINFFFKNQESKAQSLKYILTPKGLTLRTKIFAIFMKRNLKSMMNLKMN